MSRLNTKKPKVGWADELAAWFGSNSRYCDGSPFLISFKKKLLQNTDSYSSGNRTKISSALEDGLDALFKELGWDRNKESETFDWGSPDGYYGKTLDRVYEKNNKIIAVEVKATMEFNHLAAALVEGILLKKSSRLNGARFVVVSLVSKLPKKSGIEQARALAKEILPDATIVILVHELGGKPSDSQRWDDSAGKSLREGIRKFASWIQCHEN